MGTYSEVLAYHRNFQTVAVYCHRTWVNKPRSNESKFAAGFLDYFNGLNCNWGFIHPPWDDEGDDVYSKESAFVQRYEGGPGGFAYNTDLWEIIFGSFFHRQFGIKPQEVTDQVL